MKILIFKILLLWLQYSIGLSQQLIASTETESIANVIGIVGETVQLPCNFSLNKMREIELILWYKGQGTGKPIFTLDTRTTPLLKHLTSSTRRQDLYNNKLTSTNLYNKLQQSPLITTGTKRAENRLTFNLTGDFAYLQIKQVTLTDQSEYKCRVDYKQSRSDYHQVNLTIIVPPKSLRILNAKNSENLESLIGPFNEKESLVLTCQAKQGQPAPLLSWYRNGEPLEPPLATMNSNQSSLDNLADTFIDNTASSIHSSSSYTSNSQTASEEILSNSQHQSSLANVQIRQRQLSNGIVESEMTILSLTRDFLLNRIDCRSSLRNEGQIIRKDYQIISVTLDLNLSPLVVRIRSKSAQSDFRANTLAEFSCEVIGSRPLPKISWHLITQSNQIIDLVSKKHHLSNANSNNQQSSSMQIVDEDQLDDYAIFKHSPPSTTNHELDKQFKYSTNQHSTSSLLNSNLMNVHNSDDLSATSTKPASKQPLIFTIDYPLLSQDGNTSSSILKLRINQRMHLNRLICRANNFEIQRDSELEDQQLLNILYAPLVRIELGSNIQENSIKEGSDVYFECRINANPYVHEIQWFFNGNQLASNYNGILIANHSLVLQSVKRETKGYYSCQGTNSIGKSHSQNFFLRVLYAPVCREPQRSTYGLALGETTKILCQVDSDPIPNTFLWYFNNSNEKIPLRNFTVNQTSSILTYQPRSRYSYGILQCYARNEIGSQIKSCNYHIVHASVPEVVKNCEILAASSKTAKNYLQQNTNFLKLISTTKNRNKNSILSDETGLINELNGQANSNKLMTNYYTIEDLNSKSTKSLLKTSLPIFTSNGEPVVTPSAIKLNNVSHSLNGYMNGQTNSHTNSHTNSYINSHLFSSDSKLNNRSDIDLLVQASQRLNPVEPTLPTNQLQLNLDLLENAMLIKCQPGFNGGLKQIFFLEIYDVIEQRLYLNITSVENPVFLLTELKPNTKFNLNIYAANVKGRSSSVVHLNFHTFQPQISNAKKQASEESIYGSFLSILIAVGTGSTLIFSLLMLFLRFKQPRNCPSLDRSSSSSTLPTNQSQYKDAQLNPLKSSLSGRIYNNEMQNNVSDNYVDYVKEAFNNQSQHNLGLVQSEICFKQPEAVTYAELSILSPNANYSTSSAIANQNPADFVDLDFQLINNHNHLAINTNTGLPLNMPMHTITENEYSTYGQYNTLNLNPLRIHYSTSLVDSPAMTMHSKLALDTNTVRTLSSASTATVDTRQMLENNCDVQSTQYN